MTVAQLLDELMKMPREAVVLIESGGYCRASVRWIFLMPKGLERRRR